MSNSIRKAMQAGKLTKEPRAKDKEQAGWQSFLVYFAVYLLAILFWEMMLFKATKGSFEDFTLWNAIFIPAEAMALTFLSGWLTNRTGDTIWSVVVMLLPFIFYEAQMIYFCIFGSMFSMSMIGMGGDALGDFGWGMKDPIRDNIGTLLLMFLPVIVWAVLRIFVLKKLSYKLLGHGIALVLVAALWLLAVVLLPLGGKEQYSAWSAYHSKTVDTDTASSKIGVLANSLVEGSSMVFGRGTEVDEESAAEDSWDFGDDESDIDPNESGSGEESGSGTETLDTSPHIYEEIDFTYLASIAPDEETKQLCEYYAKQTGTNRNEYTGLLEGYNLVYICAESFCKWAIDPDVTPTLYRLANEGIVLNRFYNSFKNTTTNGEFALVTGIWPDVSRKAMQGSTKGTFPQSASDYMPMGLGTLFNEHYGIQSKAYHGFRGSYYGRDKSWPNLGFECKFMNSGLKFTTNWPTSDYELFKQTVPMYVNDEHFCAYYMTFSGHGPYTDSNVMYNRNIEHVQEIVDKTGKKWTPSAVGYLATHYELEKAMNCLLEELEKAGKLNNTLIVLTGDHYPYYLTSKALASIAGYTVDTVYGTYRSDCIMWCGGLKEPIIVDTPCCNVDILPTVLNLMNIEYDSRMMAGTDIFSTGTHVAALYNKSFVTEKIKYNSANGKITKQTGYENLTDDEAKEMADRLLKYINNRYSASLKTIDGDFFRFVWENTNWNQ